MNKDIIEEINKLNLEDNSDEESSMDIIENKEKELTSKQKMGIAMKRLRNNRTGNKNKKKQKKLKFNVINETELMMKYLETKEAKILRSELTSSDFKTHIKNKFTKLHIEYSVIFDMAFDKKMNIEMLKFLCQQQDFLRRGKDKYSTDVNVGKAIFDRYAKKE